MVNSSILLMGKRSLGKAEECVEGHIARWGVAGCQAPEGERAPSCTRQGCCPEPGTLWAQAHPSTHLVLVFHLQGNIRGRCLLTLLPINQRGQAAARESSEQGGRKGEKRPQALLSLWLPGQELPCPPVQDQTRLSSEHTALGTDGNHPCCQVPNVSWESWDPESLRF